MARITNEEKRIIDQGDSLDNIKARLDKKSIKPAPGISPVVPIRPDLELRDLEYCDCNNDNDCDVGEICNLDEDCPVPPEEFETATGVCIIDPNYINCDTYPFPDSICEEECINELGDINADGMINVVDIIQTINHIMNPSQLTPCQKWAADVNQDGLINVSDIVLSQNQILGNIPGCTDSTALNHNPQAGINDGSCLYKKQQEDMWGGQPKIYVSYDDGQLSCRVGNTEYAADSQFQPPHHIYASDISSMLNNSQFNQDKFSQCYDAVINGGPQEVDDESAQQCANLCNLAFWLQPDNFETNFSPITAPGPGSGFISTINWNNFSYIFTSRAQMPEFYQYWSVEARYSPSDGEFLNWNPFGVTYSDEFQGCTDNEACNYNPDAIYDDGTCEYSTEFCDCDGNILGNYCNCSGVSPQNGCTCDDVFPQGEFCEHTGEYYCNPGECVSTGSGEPDPTYGCTDNTACNYDELANTNNGLCEYPHANCTCDDDYFQGIECNDGSIVCNDYDECESGVSDCGTWSVMDCDGNCIPVSVIEQNNIFTPWSVGSDDCQSGNVISGIYDEFGDGSWVDWEGTINFDCAEWQYESNYCCEYYQKDACGNCFGEGWDENPKTGWVVQCMRLDIDENSSTYGESVLVSSCNPSDCWGVACNGDSGGPSFIIHPDANCNNTIDEPCSPSDFIQTGITSRGSLGCGAPEVYPGGSKPAYEIYASTYHWGDWINAHINSNCWSTAPHSQITGPQTEEECNDVGEGCVWQESSYWNLGCGNASDSEFWTGCDNKGVCMPQAAWSSAPSSPPPPIIGNPDHLNPFGLVSDINLNLSSDYIKIQNQTNNESRIIQGYEVEPRCGSEPTAHNRGCKYPFMVSWQRNAPRKHMCTASLISEEWVLSAKHCLYKWMNQGLVRPGLNTCFDSDMCQQDAVVPHHLWTNGSNPRNLNVGKMTLGFHELADFSDASSGNNASEMENLGMHTSDVDWIIVPWEFTTDWSPAAYQFNDIVLLHLTNPVEHFDPITLSNDENYIKQTERHMPISSGWGCVHDPDLTSAEYHLYCGIEPNVTFGGVFPLQEKHLSHWDAQTRVIDAESAIAIQDLSWEYGTTDRHFCAIGDVNDWYYQIHEQDLIPTIFDESMDTWNNENIPIAATFPQHSSWFGMFDNFCGEYLWPACGCDAECVAHGDCCIDYFSEFRLRDINYQLCNTPYGPPWP